MATRTKSTATNPAIALLAQAGEAFGKFSVSVKKEKGVVEATIKAICDKCIALPVKQQLTADDLSGKKQGKAYVAFVDALRKVADVDACSDGTRDNKLVKIRAYILNKGAKPLDLHNNALKSSAKTGANTKGKKGSTPVVNVTRPAVADLQGLPSLLLFLDGWIPANESIGSLSKFVDMARDLANAARIAATPAVSTGKAKSNGTGKKPTIVK